ncbi:tetratricopeptide repeat protein [Bradyrhizobium sp. STM 3809]|uniref:tetratricopeptide repeat protein n=1 Tax=Bradyrhizobium sp. STM 3809 TaxID=551936 RepID=UPI0024C066DC|nr:tetratricopeptide repeat protein [Bradyrhizobium sp. STM 3809]
MPQLTGCWCNLGSALLQMGQPQDAMSAYLQALALSPDHWPSRTNLVQAMLSTGQPVIAKALLLEMAAERPHDARLQHELGKVCYQLKELEAAEAHFTKAVALDTGAGESQYWIGAIRQEQGEDQAAAAAYLKAAAMQPVIRRPATRPPAAFRALVLQAPFGGNTPAEYLLEGAGYDVDILALLPSLDLATLLATLAPGDYQLIINLVSDADQAGVSLTMAAELVERLGLPVVNDPRRVANTTREATASQLAALDGCRCPRTIRLAAGGDRSPGALARLLPFDFPVLARVAGTHGGDLFERVDGIAGLARFLDQHAVSDCYLIDYVDYRSVDGRFRKYRFIFAGEAALPYHLAIGDDWKLHRDATAMEDHPWMMEEEEAFLRDPSAVFGEAQMQALHEIRRRIGLDYFGIDCALDAEGRLLVFEVNASMLVHGEPEYGRLAYKELHAAEIKQAFEALLAQKAGRA